MCKKSILAISIVLVSICAGVASTSKSFEQWSLKQAIDVLSRSSWARQETFTHVVGGIGSGIEGEKEIYNTFFVRFLSAAPIRKAYARVQQLQIQNKDLDRGERTRLAEKIQRGLNLDLSDWIVVAVTFRSNNARQESRVERFFETQTTETIKNRAFLSTKDFPKLEIQAYFPPIEQSVGAKFVFPRIVGGVKVVNPEDETVAFELVVPGADPILRATFNIEEMLVQGELVI